MCSKCNVIKELDYFFKDKYSRDGRYTLCKLCKKQACKEWRKKYPEKHNAMMRAYNAKHRRRIHYQTDYGLSLQDYQAMFDKQGGVCGICALPQTGIRPLNIDHCHLTGKIRGLLCYTCNRDISILDNEDKLRKAKIYLGL